MRTPINPNQTSTEPSSSAGPVPEPIVTKRFRRRSFIQGLGATSALLLPGAALINKVQASGDDGGGQLTKGDASILRFLATAEILESDLWEQYWELADGTLDFASPNPSGQKLTATGGNKPYHDALQILDMDMPQYVLDNTDDEFSHANFLLAYLKSKGANTADLDLLFGTHFRTLVRQPNNGPFITSQATGSTKKPRLTNLTQLTFDTSYIGRYRTDNANPDLGGINFANPVPTLNSKQHTAIPRTDDDTKSQNGNLIQAIAFTAGFHFGFIEVGGTSLYPALAQRVHDPEVLRIVLSIGPTETMHFQIWQEKAVGANAGNATPFTVTDSINNSTVTFIDLLTGDGDQEHLQANLIMPEPCPFLSPSFPICSIIRPTQTKGFATGVVKALTATNLFLGQTQEFFDLLMDLATDADEAQR
jgi:hypothetical protein